VAEFLGWVEVPSEKTRQARIERGDPNPDRAGPQEKVENALAALAYIEQGHLAESDFEGLGTKAAEALVEETRRSVIAAERVEAEAKRRAEQQEQLRQQAAPSTHCPCGNRLRASGPSLHYCSPECQEQWQAQSP